MLDPAPVVDASVCGLGGWKPNSSVLVPFPVPVAGDVFVCVLGPCVSGPAAWVAPLELRADACALAEPRSCVVLVLDCGGGGAARVRRRVARAGTAATPVGAWIETATVFETPAVFVPGPALAFGASLGGGA
ncbi:MAG TPA: hypothetical protein VH247_08455 [Thermoleophilaceae bacterium]|nr:hypothetical protein [Thermoleophilaceae bacterium]